jgi:hypothetical protein
VTGTARAPAPPRDVAWLNLDGGTDLARELAGHVVLVCFWAASSSHARVALAVLEYLEQRYAARAFAVWSVHAGRAPAENEP